MKISDFANKFSTNINTVRYYVNSGLLIPEKRNKQYRFNDQNIEDMSLIKLLKQFDFSIGEIHDILSLVRFSRLTAKDDIYDYLSILDHKKSLLLAESNRIQQAILELEKYSKTVQKMANQQEKKLSTIGVPIAFMNYICCPNCHTNLSFCDAQIENNQIMQAALTCDCGYKAAIINGILITEGRNISEYDSPDLDRKFYKDLPASWVSLFQKSYNWLNNRMQKMDLKNKIVYENHINCYFFLYTILGKLPKDALYIVSDKYLEVITLYKDLIEKQNLGYNILFIADSSHQLPLKKASIDLYIDYCSSNEYAFFNTDDDLFTITIPYLSPDAQILGTYFYFDPGSRSHHKLLQEYPTCLSQNYLLSHLKELVRHHQLQVIDKENNGFAVDDASKNRNFSFHNRGDKIHLYSYQCRL